MDIINETRQQVVNVAEALQSLLMGAEDTNNYIAAAAIHARVADNWLQILADKEGINDAVEYEAKVEPFTGEVLDEVYELMASAMSIVHFFDNHRWGKLRDDYIEVDWCIKTLNEVSFILSYEAIRLEPDTDVEALIEE